MKQTLFALVLSLLLTALPLSGRATSEQSDTPLDEAQVKAQIILNLPLVTVWPEGVLQKGAKTHICSLADSTVSQRLQSMAMLDEYADHIVIMRSVQPEELPDCHLLYIDSEDHAIAQDVLRVASQLPILTVGTLNKFITKGGMVGLLHAEKTIGLFSEKNVRFEVNLDNVARADIELDPLLLELAERIVYRGGADD